MKLATFGGIFFLLLAVGCNHTESALCPRHIEEPIYPAIARTADIAGKLVVAVTIDANGKVSRAEITNRTTSLKLLEQTTLNNIRSWTFTPPRKAPHVQTVVYDYEINKSPEFQGVQVSYDLPDRVNIIAGLPEIETSGSHR